MASPDLTIASRKELVSEWRRVFKCREPEKAGAKVLRTCLQVQFERQGNIQACNKAHAKLMSRLKRYEAGNDAIATQTGLSPGTELMRSYSGQTYTVLVRGAGFEWNGTRYGFLSEIATTIIGSRRSGPKFFGLKS
ncbi:DUF2924 domain-containing protein [Rhodobacteraceae bacterium]|nr:DUF2924 domain-containing protein [Paracoccaceae bacterium]